MFASRPVSSSNYHNKNHIRQNVAKQTPLDMDVSSETLLGIIGEAFADEFARMYRNPLVRYAGVRLVYVQDRRLYVALFDACWRDDTDICGGSFAVYCDVDLDTFRVDIWDVDCACGKRCDDDGSVVDRIPPSFEDASIRLL